MRRQRQENKSDGAKNSKESGARDGTRLKFEPDKSLDLLCWCTTRLPNAAAHYAHVAEPHARAIGYITQQPTPYICFSTALLI